MIRFLINAVLFGFVGWLIGGYFGSPMIGLAIGLGVLLFGQLVLAGAMLLFMGMLIKLMSK